MAAESRSEPSGQHVGVRGVVRAREWAQVQEDQSLALYHAILEQLPLRPLVRLLDLACGTGRFCQLASARGASVTGVDRSPSMIAIAHARVPTATFRVGPLASLPFPNEQFAIVTAINAIQYCAEPLRVLREARRVTQMGGAIALAAWSEEDLCEAQVPLAAIDALLLADRPRGPHPFSLSADGSLETLVTRVGLTPMDAADVRCDWTYPNLDAAVRAFLSTGPALCAIRVVGEAMVSNSISASLAPFRMASGEYVLRNTARYVMARA